ncbi:MAG: lysophospholipid acyltransferase family protein [Sphingobacteriaceae bacterium]|nr:lysophospholipid acyltransferase family protein [Sphingobacteriaceae bacterium]
MRISYWLQKLGIAIFSSLPLFLLYVLADFLFLLNYYLVGYRKAVVRENLKKAFPARSASERLQIEKDFYRYLSDQLVETFKTFQMSENDVLKRVEVLNPEVMNDLAAKGQHVVHLLGHHANWEWYAKALALKTKHWLFFVYKPLNNKGFDALMKQMRERFGVRAVPMKSVFSTIESNLDKVHASFFGGDQSPMAHNRFIWTPFMHQPTAVYLGAEDIAKKYNAAVVFGKMRRVKRGYYTIELKLITDTPNETAFGDITRAHTRLLEELLEEQPQYWLWSHKRWKLQPDKHPSNATA